MENGTTTTSSDSKRGTNIQAYVMGVICLFIGLAFGYLLRGSARPDVRLGAATAAAPTAAGPAAPNMSGTAPQQITPQQLKNMADTQSAPLIERLKKEPKNAQLLADVGNLYYDARQFPMAIDFYQRSLKIRPGNTNVRVDLGTAFWYVGDPDSAIAQYKTVLKTEPTKVNALMNLGVVEWQGKMDVPAAVAAWEKLLSTNPNFEGKNQVELLIAQAKKHSSLPPGAKTFKPPM